MRSIGLLALAAVARLAAGVSPEESKCRFRGVRLQMYDDADVNLYNMLITFREQDKSTDHPGVVSWIRVEDGQGVNCVAHGSDGSQIFLRGIHDTIGDVNPPQPIVHVTCNECPDDLVAAPSAPAPSAPTPTSGAPAPPTDAPAPAPPTGSPAAPSPPPPGATTMTTAPPDRVQATQSPSGTPAIVTMTGTPNNAAAMGSVGRTMLYAGVAGLGALLWAGLA